mgnify:CR=1 FL=1
MELNKLPKIVKGKKKRLGRGYGSGKGGHTVGRGQKGQKSRSGGKAKRPRDYGKKRGFEPPKRHEPEILNVSRLNIFSDGSKVDPQALVDKGLVRRVPEDGIKILGRGELKKKLTVTGLLYSGGAKSKIEKAGGKVLGENF